MPTAMQVVLLERIENLGNLGEVVKVKPGYARNYLLPQKKALRATKDNIAYFESQRAALEKLSAEKQKEAEKFGKKIAGLKVVIVRHAAEGGQLYGSVSARDVAEAATEQGGHEIGRSQVQLNTGIKSVGLYPVTVSLHPEVKVEITVNIARSEEEAKVQAKTGKAVVNAGAPGAPPAPPELSEEAKKALLEESALANEKAEGAESAEDAAEAAARAEKSAKRAAKKKAKAKPAAEEAEGESDEE